MTHPGPSATPRTSRLTVLLVALLVALTGTAGVVWWNVVHVPGDRSSAAVVPPPTTPASPPPSTPPPTASPTPSSPGLPRSQTPLGDEQIVWRHGDGTSWRMSTISSTGVEGSVVLGAGEQDIAPHITADRRTVIYLKRERPGERTSVHAVAADGSSERFLFRDGSEECPSIRSIALSPTGTIGLVCKDSGGGSSFSLVTATLDGTVQRTLDHGLIGTPTFSPDGEYLLYPRSSFGSWKRGGALYLVPTDGSEDPVKLVNGRNTAPAWAPVGDEIAFSRFEDDDVAQILTARVGSSLSDVKVLTSDHLISGSPTWSPDGGSLAYSRGPDEDHTQLVVMTSQGEEQRALSVAGTIGTPSWTSR